ncbi:uncharacterized protein MONBRDRAFT_8926 [Monosiga brevicollis MX1]|uniref:Uncharacterized protein n=1 Tax=Monosiga brevicollis TaxID=81824 RepID=A9V1J4_MONBE|nr:uncharacterized protein MONBRDRAFT_8926 [Monosiga brevicollis MX1]EDQ88577.1 predicted protein [Monosiga brevicollis MX1]|eukprot:XP_001746681.1 hypothetical protein [Monosiga brevicollis MX1]
MASAAASTAAAATTQAARGGFFRRRIATPIKEGTQALIRDYRDVFVNMAKDARDRPFLAALKLAAAGTLAYACVETPDEHSFESRLMDSASDIIECAGVHNEKSNNYVQRLMALRGEGRLGYLYLGPCAIMYEKRKKEGTEVFAADYMPWRLEIKWIWDHIIEWGYFQQWPQLEAMMVDYDIVDE